MPGSDPKSWSPQGKSGSSEKGSSPREHDSSSGGGPTLKKASTNHSAMETAMLLYPLLENRWLYLVKLLHTFAYSCVPLKIGEEQGEKAIAKAIVSAEKSAQESSENVTIIKSLLDEITLKINAAKAKISDIRMDISDNAKLAAAQPALAGIVARGTQNLLEEIETETGLLATYEQVFEELSAEIVKRSEQAAVDAEKLATLKS
jgi:hypothetical protein